MKNFCLIAAILAIGLSAAAHANMAPPPPDTAANRALVVEAFQRLFVERKLFDDAEKYLATDFIEHNPTSQNGTEAVKAFFKDLMEQNPDFTVEAKRVIADGDLVFVHFHMRLNPQDRGVAGVDIFRVENGKIVEHWDVMQPVPEKSANNNTMF